MKKLLSLPPNLVNHFHAITGFSTAEYFCTHDPIGHKLGSGGGTAWLLLKALAHEKACNVNKLIADEALFCNTLSAEKRILIHAGGQSRRLPSYAPSGKILTPIPVYRWERGQKLSQNLLSLQLPLYEKMMQKAPDNLKTMVVSGDVLIRTTQPLQDIPQADVVCYGLWLGAEIAKNHGVFVLSRNNASQLKCMMQKPSVEQLSDLAKDHYYLTDIGVWLLSERAVKALMHHAIKDGEVGEYDLYGTFGCCLGTNPSLQNEEINQLSVAVLPLHGGEFYHFGTSRELISSTLAIQNLVSDQRKIIHRSRKPHPAIFVQNAITLATLSPENQEVWIENSFIGKGWRFSKQNIVTGIPPLTIDIALEEGQCIDVVPVGETQWVVRTYNFHDSFAGKKQFEAVFPIVENTHEMACMIGFLLGKDKSKESQLIYEKAIKLSAEAIGSQANLQRLTQQRTQYRTENWTLLAKNHEHSVFYQLDLEDAAQAFSQHHIAMPQPLSADVPLMTRIHDAMFRSEVERLNGKAYQAYEDNAFDLLRYALSVSAQEIPDSYEKDVVPVCQVATDQIVWARSPVRIDLAGGWTDTPPYCLMEGGSVINMAIELNGQPPIQTYVKPCKELHVVLRSIDLGATEIISTYEELANYAIVGSPFSIPKAALNLAGFALDTQKAQFKTLYQQLEAFGCGIEITLLSAIPAGSGLGTSSVLMANVLGALNDFCGLGWDKQTIALKTLLLEQLLTTGGGWQDQAGGLLHGVKLLQTMPQTAQVPAVRWLPEGIFAKPDYAPCHLLYYTGLRRTAKTILSEIVRGMFLNRREEIVLLREMKAHTQEMYDAIQREDFVSMGHLVHKTWQQKQCIDSGTSTMDIKRLETVINDLCLGYTLPGAGGGGYMYMVAKDTDAAARIRQILTANPLNNNARFVDLSLSHTGLQVSRS